MARHLVQPKRLIHTVIPDCGFNLFAIQRHIRLDDLYGCQPNGSTLNRGKLIVNMHRGEIPFIDCRYIRRGLTT